MSGLVHAGTRHRPLAAPGRRGAGAAKTLQAVAVGALLLAGGAGARAAELGSNVVELGYLRVNGGGAGPVASVSAEVGDAGWYVGFGHGRHRGGDANEEGSSAAAFIGYAYGVAPLTDLTAEFAYQRTVEAGVATGSLGASVGAVRALVADRLLVSARANHYFGGGLESAETTAALGLDFYLTPQWSVYGEVEFGAATATATLLALHYNY